MSSVGEISVPKNILSKELAKLCLLSLYDCHTSDKDPLYKKVSENIIDDMLMGKYDKEGNLKSMTEKVHDLIHNYYIVAKQFRKKYFLKIVDSHDHILPTKYTVYRGTSTTQGLQGKQIKFKIPFSTSIEYDNVYNWIGDNCCIWKITFSDDTLFLCLDNPNEGKELILPEGTLYIERETENEDGIKMYECSFEQSERL